MEAKLNKEKLKIFCAENELNYFVTDDSSDNSYRNFSENIVIESNTEKIYTSPYDFEEKKVENTTFYPLRWGARRKND